MTKHNDLTSLSRNQNTVYPEIPNAWNGSFDDSVIQKCNSFIIGDWGENCIHEATDVQ